MTPEDATLLDYTKSRIDDATPLSKEGLDNDLDRYMDVKKAPPEDDAGGPGSSEKGSKRSDEEDDESECSDDSGSSGESFTYASFKTFSSDKQLSILCNQKKREKLLRAQLGTLFSSGFR